MIPASHSRRRFSFRPLRETGSQPIRVLAVRVKVCSGLRPRRAFLVGRATEHEMLGRRNVRSRRTDDRIISYENRGGTFPEDAVGRFLQPGPLEAQFIRLGREGTRRGAVERRRSLSSSS